MTRHVLQALPPRAEVYQHVFSALVLYVTVAAGTLRMPCVTARAFPAHDGGEASGVVAGRGVQRSGGAQGAQVPLRAPQST